MFLTFGHWLVRYPLNFDLKRTDSDVLPSSIDLALSLPWYDLRWYTSVVTLAALTLRQLQVTPNTSQVARSQFRVADIVHEILMLLVDKGPFIPVELRQIRRVLPALYEGLWACDLGPFDRQTDGGSTADIVVALNECEIRLWLLHEIVQGSCKDVPVTPNSSEATAFEGLESLATAKRLIKQMQAVLSALSQRARPQSSKEPRSHKMEDSLGGRGVSSRAGKYVCTGAGGQYNTVQEGGGYQTITNTHKTYGNAGARSTRTCQ